MSTTKIQPNTSSASTATWKSYNVTYIKNYNKIYYRIVVGNGDGELKGVGIADRHIGWNNGSSYAPTYTYSAYFSANWNAAMQVAVDFNASKIWVRFLKVAGWQSSCWIDDVIAYERDSIGTA